MKTRVLFICHGNICRSPMAEFVFKDLVHKANLDNSIYVESMATSTEALGMHVHRRTREQLNLHNIFGYENKRAVQMTRRDYDNFDYIIVMDSLNMRNIRYITDDKDNKIKKLLYFAGSSEDIDDPWYTGDFELTYRQIDKGCRALLKHIQETEQLWYIIIF